MNDPVRHSPGTVTIGARCIIGALALGWNTGCSGLSDGPIEDLGSTGGGTSLSAPAPVPEKQFPEQIDPGFEGHWGGYVEDPFQRDELGQALPFVFPSGSSEVRLDYRFVVDSDEVIPSPEATLVFGAGPAPVLAQGAAYPAGVNHYFSRLRANFWSFTAPVVEGFVYSLKMPDPAALFAGYDPGNASLLTFPELEAFEDWCGLQVPLTSGVRPECVGISGLSGGDPYPGGDPCIVTHEDRTEEEVDCNYATMCMSDLCLCDATSCWFNPAKAAQQSLVYLERQGDELVGTISGATLDPGSTPSSETTLGAGQPGWYMPMGTLRLHRADE